MISLLKSFFCNRKGKFNPPYFWITLLMILTITMFVMRFFEKGNFSDTLILGVLGLVVAWCGVYNYGKKIKISDEIKDEIKNYVKEFIKESLLDKKKKGKK